MFNVTFELLNKYWNPKTMTQPTSDSELQSSDSEYPDDSEDDAHCNYTLQKWATLSNPVTRYSLSQTLMSNASQYIASKGFRYNYYICRWWLGGGGFVIIFGRFGGGSELICFCWEVRYCAIFILAKLIFGAPVLIIIAQSLILWYFRP